MPVISGTELETARDQVVDPFRPMIGAYNDYLHWYLMYRSRRLTERQIETMDENGRDLLDTLQTVFPHEVTYTRKDNSVYRRSTWCTEKPHAIKHAGENYRAAGRCKNYSVQALETRHKSALKAVAHKTNNQASVGRGSVLRANMQLEASEDMARHVDRKGMHLIHTLITLDAHCAHLAHFFTWCARSLDGVHGVLKVLSKFVQSVQSSQKVCSTAGGRCPAVACAHRVHTGNTWCTHMILFVHTMHTLCTFRAKVCS